MHTKCNTVPYSMYCSSFNHKSNLDQFVFYQQPIDTCDFDEPLHLYSAVQSGKCLFKPRAFPIMREADHQVIFSLTVMLRCCEAIRFEQDRSCCVILGVGRRRIESNDHVVSRLSEPSRDGVLRPFRRSFHFQSTGRPRPFNHSIGDGLTTTTADGAQRDKRRIPHPKRPNSSSGKRGKGRAYPGVAFSSSWAVRSHACVAYTC